MEAILYALFPCAFVTFVYCVQGQVWYLIMSIPDLAFLFTLSADYLGLYVSPKNKTIKYVLQIARDI